MLGITIFQATSQTFCEIHQNLVGWGNLFYILLGQLISYLRSQDFSQVN